MEKRLLTEKEAADYLNFQHRTLQTWRINGDGPIFVKTSKRSVRYRIIDLDNWIEERLRQSTSENLS